MGNPHIQAKEPYAAYRFTVDEYYKLADLNILQEGERVELLDGRLLVKEPPGPAHAAHVRMIGHLFMRRLGSRVIVCQESPFRIDELNHPEPDLAIVKPRDDFYAAEHPGPEDALLLIEVAWSSASGDREIKAPLYAVAGIPEFWLVDIPDQTLEVYREPGVDGYRHVERLDRHRRIVPSAFPDVEIAVADLVRPVSLA